VRSGLASERLERTPGASDQAIEATPGAACLAQPAWRPGEWLAHPAQLACPGAAASEQRTGREAAQPAGPASAWPSCAWSLLFFLFFAFFFSFLQFV
jgi:hypothetical protein